MQRKPPKILHQEVIAQTRIFCIEALDLEFSNGVQRQFERIPGGNRSVLIVPFLEAGNNLLLIREYAAGTERYELGFPKGLVGPEEDPLVAANRELQEEIGYGAQRIEPLQTLSIAPGYIGHRTHILLAWELYPRKMPGDEPEPVEILSWPLRDMDRLLAREDFSEARAVAALFLAHRYWETRKKIR